MGTATACSAPGARAHPVPRGPLPAHGTARRAPPTQSHGATRGGRRRAGRESRRTPGAVVAAVPLLAEGGGGLERLHFAPIRGALGLPGADGTGAAREPPLALSPSSPAAVRRGGARSPPSGPRRRPRAERSSRGPGPVPSRRRLHGARRPPPPRSNRRDEEEAAPGGAHRPAAGLSRAVPREQPAGSGRPRAAGDGEPAGDPQRVRHGERPRAGAARRAGGGSGGSAGPGTFPFSFPPSDPRGALCGGDASHLLGSESLACGWGAGPDCGVRGPQRGSSPPPSPRCSRRRSKAGICARSSSSSFRGSPLRAGAGCG